MTRGERLVEFASRRRRVWLPALLAVALCLPALGTGWQLDDHFQRLAMLRLAAHDVGPLEVFSVLQGDPEVTRTFVEWGVLPWWTADGFRMAFLRHLSVLSTWLDYALWPSSAPLMHLHSLLWLGAVVLMATLAYRRLSAGAGVAALAALFFALEDAHAVPAGWLANRNVLLSAFFGLAALVAHHEWRQTGRRWGAWAAPALLALGLAAGENALAAVGYIFAHALVLDRAPLRSRLAALLGPGLVVVAWVLIYRGLGFGVAGSGIYLDPVGEAPRFLAALGTRLPLLLLGQWTPLPADLGPLLPPPAAVAVWLFAVGWMALVAVAVAPLWKEHRELRFWVVGMALALLPVAATFPSNRLLLFVGFGAFPVAALVVCHYLGAASTSRRSPRYRLGRGVAWALLLTHLVLAPLLKPLGTRSVVLLGEPMIAAADSLMRYEDLADRDVVFVNAPDTLLFVTNAPTLLTLAGVPAPRRLRALSSGPTAIEIERVGERELELRLESGLFSGVLGTLFRHPGETFEPGAERRLEGMRASVEEVGGDNVPRVVRYAFDRPLTDPELLWLRWDGEGWAAFEPPALGTTTRLAAACGPLDLLRPGC